MAHEFQSQEKIIRVSNAAAAGTSDVNCTGVDTAGFRSVEFLALFGTLTSTQVTSLKAQQSDDNGSADGWSDIADSATAALADADSNDMLRLEVVHPTKRYVRCVVDRGTANAVLDGVVAILRGPAVVPVTEDATVIDSVFVVGAAEGTA